MGQYTWPSLYFTCLIVEYTWLSFVTLVKQANILGYSFFHLGILGYTFGIWVYLVKYGLLEKRRKSRISGIKLHQVGSSDSKSQQVLARDDMFC